MNTITSTEAITGELLTDAIDWASDCLNKSAGVRVSEARATEYVKRNYPGGVAGFARDMAASVMV